jgi:signal transduction histidine kinase
MWFSQNAPIRRKLRIITMVACSVALLTACAALFGFQLVIFRRTFQRDLVALSEIISTNTTAAIAFKDRESAQDILASLVAKPQIKGAAILCQDGSTLAKFGTGWAPAPSVPAEKAGFYYEGKELAYAHPVILDKARIGTLGLRTDYTSEFSRLLILYLAISGSVLSVSILVAFVVSGRIQGVITGPILNLAETARVVAEGKDYSVRAEKIENDEVGLLTDAFNQMLAQIQVQENELVGAREKLEQQVSALSHQILERKRAESKLEELHKQLLETSRQAGMAEVATGVLHNVGNVLNSVNVSTTLLVESGHRSKIHNLQKAVALLNEQGDQLAGFLSSDPRGKVLLGYLTELAEHLIREGEATQKEVDLLAKNIQHIKDIVAMQQNYAKVSGLSETLAIEPLVEDALQMNLAALIRHNIQLVRRFQEVPLVNVDRHKILQILVNLIQNAKYALTEQPGNSPQVLTLIINTTDSGFVQVRVSDTGVGIAPENITRIFAHGFTTRKEGHGFGLHSGAIAAKEMGGSLTAYSKGIGHGATFTLQIPIPPQPDEIAEQ